MPAASTGAGSSPPLVAPPRPHPQLRLLPTRNPGGRPSRLQVELGDGQHGAEALAGAKLSTGLVDEAPLP